MGVFPPAGLSRVVMLNPRPSLPGKKESRVKRATKLDWYKANNPTQRSVIFNYILGPAKLRNIVLKTQWCG